MPSIDEKIQGLLGSPTFNLGVGLLSQAGPSLQPRSFGQQLGGAMQFLNQQQAAQLDLKAKRDLIEQRQQSKNIFAELGGLLSPEMSPGPVVAPIGPAPISTPQGQQKLISLLGQVAPNAVSSVILNRAFPQTNMPTYSRELNDFQYFQSNPEQLAAYQNFQQSSRDPIEAQRENLLRLQTEQALQELSQSRESRQQQRANTQLSTIQDLEHLRELAERNSSLKGTFLESGLPARGLARTALGTVQAIQDAFGVDSSQARRINTDFDSFDKLASNLTLNSLARYTALGALNNSELQQVVRANAQLGASPDTNAMIISDAIKTIVRSANVSGVQIENPEEWLKYADSLNSGNGGQTNEGQGTNTQPAPLVLDYKDLD